MMNEFEYVMILVSIVIGLGVTHILSSAGKIQYRLTKHGKNIRLSVAHTVYCIFVLSWMLLFWWFEFKLGLIIENWTLSLYFFIVFYATMLFMLAHILLPSKIDDIEDFGDYFIKSKTWFYSLLIFTTSLDIFDAYLKGLNYLQNLDWSVWTYFAVLYSTCIIGLSTKNIKVHNSLSIIVCLVYFFAGFFGGYIL